MEGINIFPKGVFERTGQELAKGDHSDLILQEKGIEAVFDRMPKGTVGFFYPPEDGMAEIYYIISGEVAIYDLDERIILSTGDVYSLQEFNKYIMFEALADTQELYINNRPNFDENEARISKLMDVLQQLQATDGDTMAHCERVKANCMGIAYQMRFDQTKLKSLFYAARFHDVGKSKIPLEILLKPGRLTAEEYEVMKQHSQYTYEMIREHYDEEIASIAYEHHERLDGKGYPRGLSGAEISLPARIICVADAYDAMVTSRPYHKGLTQAAALSELWRCVGTQFDADVISALERFLALRAS